MPSLGTLVVLLMVAICFFLLYMEISLFASLFGPPGLSNAHETTRSFNHERQHVSAEGSVSSFTPFAGQGRRGPNSPGGAAQNMDRDRTKCTTEVQVAAGSTTAVEFRSSGVGKPSGETARASRPAVSAADRVKKRSLLRARKRAAGDPMGLAWYRGRLMNSTQLGRVTLNSSTSNMHAACHSLPPLNKNRHKPRIQVATLNVGGFDQVTYDAFMQFWTSSACQYDVICTQEIHFGLGKSSREWSASGWHVITSVSTRFAGIAFFIRSSRWSSQEIRFKSLVPGRLMHLRLDCKDFAFDVIGVYQHARPYMQQKGTSEVLEQRAKIWAQLRNILASLPRRNQLAVLGDMNTNLQSAKGIAGPGTLKPATPHKDQKELQIILQQFQLCALNTWSKLATNVGSEHDTQIDFILVRRQYADRVARNSCPVPDLNFSPWRSGQRHLLVEATLPFFPGWRKHTPAIKPIDGASLRNSVMGADEKCLMLRQKFQGAKLWAPQVSVNLAKMQDLRGENLCPPSPCKSCRSAGLEGAKL